MLEFNKFLIKMGKQPLRESEPEKTRDVMARIDNLEKNLLPEGKDDQRRI